LIFDDPVTTVLAAECLAWINGAGAYAPVGGSPLIAMAPRSFISVRAINMGTIASPESGVLVTMTEDLVPSNDYWNAGYRLEVVDPTTYNLKATTCIVDSATVAGPADTLTLARDLATTITAIGDKFFIVPDTACTIRR
jgi:hypothetical protein